MLKFLKILIPVFLIFILNPALFSQQQFTVITGEITDSTGRAIPLTNITVREKPGGTFSDNNGLFMLRTVADKSASVLVISSIGFITREIPFTASDDTIHFNIRMEVDISALREVIIRDEGLREAPAMFRIPVKDISFMPVTTGAIESVLKSMPGVNSPNELSNQYLVRGGNYDENLVYVNDIEIYRPQLIRSGRQEGLSFINQDLTGSVIFSTGGFNASYGDKMSSVLDIKYREPDQFRGSVSAALLTSSVHAEGISKGKKISFITGARYMTNRFLLKTLDTKANYTPAFYDLQAHINLVTGDKSVLKLLVTYSNNKYSFVPISQRSSFGNFKEAYQLYVAYEGSEIDSYQTTNSALSWEWNPIENFENRFIIQYYNTSETETYDIRGYYSLNMLDKNLGSENLGDSIMNIGIGSWLDHARNSLKGEIISINYKSRWEHANNVLSWGLKFNNEHITDNINEWRRIDSAGYTVPYSV
ncbi:MAG: TonB-dependent receptor, partial [Bacteroidales bacterium]|nr:TonB-dependent receptor [Bacteroidales bacterium]